MCSNRFTWLSADITILPCTFLISLERNIQMCTTYGRFDLPDIGGGGVIIKSLFCCLIFHNVLKCVQFLIIQKDNMSITLLSEDRSGNLCISLFIPFRRLGKKKKMLKFYQSNLYLFFFLMMIDVPIIYLLKGLGAQYFKFYFFIFNV